jgi:hypothetical protein
MVFGNDNFACETVDGGWKFKNRVLSLERGGMKSCERNFASSLSSCNQTES